MIKTILKLLIEVLGKKAIKAGLEEKALKYENYITVGKGIWHMVDENFRITQTVEEKLESKAEQFDKLLLAKFPELSDEDIKELRQSIAGEFNQDKAEVLNQVDTLKQLQAENDKLKLEKASLQDQLTKVKTLVNPTVQTQQDPTIIVQL